MNNIPKWLVVVLMLLFNTAAGLVPMNLFPPGSAGAIVLSVAAMVLGNALALFGVPVVDKKAVLADVKPLEEVVK